MSPGSCTSPPGKHVVSVPISATSISAVWRDTPRDGIEPTYSLLGRATDRMDLRIKTENGVIQAVHLTQQLGQYQAMMRFDPAVQRLGQRLPLTAQAAFRYSGPWP